jgi:hypothetical protein
MVDIVFAVATSEPMIPSEIDGSLSCFFCRKDQPGASDGLHESNCAYVAACESLARISARS